MTWSETFVDAFKKNDVRFISSSDKPGAAQTPR